ncbi:hypothetical protein ACGFW5_09510 [Streptomyces sp. NPDC048416]|uniref:hypothetical protein n=1 Tax=Streptomyces sp. NPDC048416 TaxID=3365546 RepID=UPI00371BD774
MVNDVGSVSTRNFLPQSRLSPRKVAHSSTRELLAHHDTRQETFAAICDVCLHLSCLLVATTAPWTIRRAGGMEVMSARAWVRATRALIARGRTRPYPYGLLAPVARVATIAAADEIRRFLTDQGIRSTVAPSPPRRHVKGLRSQVRFQVLVFIEDVSLARHLVHLWTIPVHSV